VGSLETGKDGDFVVWSGDPLSTTTVALETWIDGKKYFDRTADVAARPALESERAALIAKAKTKAESTATEGLAEKPKAGSGEGGSR